MKIFHRFHFSSALKRMSVIAGHTPQGSVDVHYIAAVKGAPETIRNMVIVWKNYLLAYYLIYRLTYAGVFIYGVAVKCYHTRGNWSTVVSALQELACHMESQFYLPPDRGNAPMIHVLFLLQHSLHAWKISVTFSVLSIWLWLSRVAPVSGKMFSLVSWSLIQGFDSSPW